MSEPRVYVNGQKAGEWNYGYNYFTVDITSFINEGQNTLAVGLTNHALSSRWYPGAGLYRKVRLIVKDEISIEQWGTSITTPLVTAAVAQVNVKTKVNGQKLRIVSSIVNAKGDTVATESSNTQVWKWV